MKYLLAAGRAVAAMVVIGVVQRLAEERGYDKGYAAAWEDANGEPYDETDYAGDYNGTIPVDIGWTTPVDWEWVDDVSPTVPPWAPLPISSDPHGRGCGY
jgi:hypothetical protein